MLVGLLRIAGPSTADRQKNDKPKKICDQQLGLLRSSNRNGRFHDMPNQNGRFGSSNNPIHSQGEIVT